MGEERHGLVSEIKQWAGGLGDSRSELGTVETGEVHQGHRSRPSGTSCSTPESLEALRFPPSVALDN